MSFAKKTVSLAFTGLMLSSSLAFAQTGGADVPTDAKKQGTMENGPSSTGMSKDEAKGGSMKGGSMSKDSGSMKKSDGMEKKM